MERTEKAGYTRSESLNKCVGGSRSGRVGSPDRDPFFIERPRIFDTWSPARQEFWDFLADRFRGRCTPQAYLNVSELARDYDCSRTWIQDNLSFLIRCNLLSLDEENESQPNRYRIHWDFREREAPDLPFLFTGGCNKFSDFQGNAESSISDEQEPTVLTDNQRHRVMKYLRIQFTGKPGSVLVSMIGKTIWKGTTTVQFMEYLLSEAFTLYCSISDRLEDSGGPWIFGLTQRWINNLTVRYENRIQQELRRQEKKKDRRDSTACPDHLIDELEQNGVIAA